MSGRPNVGTLALKINLVSQLVGAIVVPHLHWATGALLMALAADLPQARGLYDPAFEHDACGVAMVATLNKVATHGIVSKALRALKNLEHRGASGAEPDSGDGAGILIRIPINSSAQFSPSHCQKLVPMLQVSHLWQMRPISAPRLKNLRKRRLKTLWVGENYQLTRRPRQERTFGDAEI